MLHDFPLPGSAVITCQFRCCQELLHEPLKSFRKGSQDEIFLYNKRWAPLLSDVLFVMMSLPFFEWSEVRQMFPSNHLLVQQEEEDPTWLGEPEPMSAGCCRASARITSKVA